MAVLKVERIGGFAGFGGFNSRLRSIGEIDLNKLSQEDKETVDNLFKSQKNAGKDIAPDEFRYRISRTTARGTENIEAGERAVPNLIKQLVRDQII